MSYRRTPWYAYASLLVLLLITLFPVLWMVITALKTPLGVKDLDHMWIPHPVTLSNFVAMFTRFPLLDWMGHSFYVSLTSTLVAVLAGALGGYALARLRFAGRDWVGFSVLVTYLIPPTVLFIPLNRLIHQLGLSDTLTSLIVTYPTFTVPLATWLLIGFFKSIPLELEHAALIDGANRGQVLTRVVLPLARPGLVAAALFAFTNSWNEFLYALVFINDNHKSTLTVGLTTNLVMGDVYLWGELMAAAILATVPVVVLYIYLQKYVVAGLTAGAVKG